MDILDKGKMSIIVAEKLFYLGTELQARIETHSVLRGMGGFGHKGTTKSTLLEVRPSRQPDFVKEESLPRHAGILYRLTGDYNPLHIDPAVAESVGFKEPILHGLCHYGYVQRAIYERYGCGDPTRIKRMAVRFTQHVFPGETLVIEMWKDSNKVYYEARTKERGDVVTKGVQEYHPESKL